METEEPSPKDIARIAVAGAGWWAQGWHLPLLHNLEYVQIAAIIEPSAQPRSTLVKDMDSTDQLRIKYNAPVFSNIDELIASKIPVVGIIVSSPHATHASIVIKALEAGFHVMCEKPMTTDPEEAHLLLAHSEKFPNQIFMVNNTANWREKSRYIHDTIKEGALGQIKHVTSYFGVNLGWLFNDPANTGWVEPTGKMLGNGFCWGQLSHTLAWIYKSTGLVPQKAFAFLGYSETTKADTHCAIGITCKSGAIISISGNADAHNPGDCKVIDNLIIGTKGSLRYHGKAGDVLVVDDSGYNGGIECYFTDGTSKIVEGFEFENLERGAGENGGKGPEIIHAFIDGCLGKPYYNGADAQIAMYASVTIDAIYRSAQSGKAEAIL